MAHHFILLRLNPFSLRIDREGWCVNNSMRQLRLSLPAEGAKNASLFWLSLLQGVGGLSAVSTGKFVYMAHHFIMLRLNSFSFIVDRERWYFEHSISQLRVCLPPEGAKNVS